MKERVNRMSALMKRHGREAALIVLGAAALYVIDEELFLLMAVMFPVIAVLALVCARIRAWSMDRAEARSEEYRPLLKIKPGPKPAPQQKPKPAPQPGPVFTAAGRGYLSPAQLTAEKTQTERVYTDCHGRTVLALRERFPCFDSYDYLYEDRYFRWYFILHEGALTLVRTQDDRDEYAVTERITKAQWARCGLDAYNQDVFRKLGFDQYLQDKEGENA